jgi:hypothetical protein
MHLELWRGIITATPLALLIWAAAVAWVAFR